MLNEHRISASLDFVSCNQMCVSPHFPSRSSPFHTTHAGIGMQLTLYSTQRGIFGTLEGVGWCTRLFEAGPYAAYAFPALWEGDM